MLQRSSGQPLSTAAVLRAMVAGEKHFISYCEGVLLSLVLEADSLFHHPYSSLIKC